MKQPNCLPRSYLGLRRRRLQPLQDGGCERTGVASLNRATHYLNKSNLAVGVYKCLVFQRNADTSRGEQRFQPHLEWVPSLTKVGGEKRGIHWRNHPRVAQIQVVYIFKKFFEQFKYFVTIFYRVCLRGLRISRY